MESVLNLQKECPGLLELLQKLFTATDVADIAGDYVRSASAGANTEDGFEREEGVSFRPRVARVVTILVKEGGLRDVATVRAAIVACAAARGLEIECGERIICETVAESLSGPAQAQLSPSGFAVAIALELDTIRHLHMTSVPPHYKEQRLAEAERLACRPVSGGGPEIAVLRDKLSHAIKLQRRSLQDPWHGGAQ